MSDHDSSGDYGYDLVQEVKAALHLPTARARVLPVRGGAGPRRELDSDGDLGYDLVHEA